MSDGATNTPRDSPGSKPYEPYFIVPPGFRQNSIFVGMDKEYQELGRRLFDRRRREGTACVLLHGAAGVGKAHLARQYVYKNRNKFNGGIFWINCEGSQEMLHAFWNIKQKVVARDSPELCDGVNSGDFVQLVKTWFETRHEWLIVYDGVRLESDEDVTNLERFVPDSKNSSIIYVSRQSNLESKQELLRPVPIKVKPLKEPDAVKLLFKELHNKKPSETDKKAASEIVKKRGGLPLAILGVSHRVTDMHIPLPKYPLSTSGETALQTTYNEILDDLLKDHMEAWNLINILCWFASNIPVEMVHLGLGILRARKVEVKSPEEAGEPNINATFFILMRKALIERNDTSSDKESMSSSRDSLSEPEPIDMLKLQKSVQSILCDSLHARSLLPIWLGHAIKLFSFSYHQADRKIKQKKEPGRVSDYRYYLVHGQRLWDHTIGYDSRKLPLDHLRTDLRPVIDNINAEIRRREPGSSQESLKNGIFQASIFDKTNSSSDSNDPPGPQTPQFRPTPPRLDSESIFGIPLDREPTDSPNSFGTASPGIHPKIYDHSPGHRPFEFDDPGYDSDRENHLHSKPMEQSWSESTERPANRPRAPTAESHVGGWQIVPSSFKPKKPRKRRDLGTFRPTGVSAQLNKENAVRPESSDGKGSKRDTSPALKALRNVQSKSPTALQNRIVGFFQRTMSGSSAKPAEPEKPTWAGIAAGKFVSAKKPLPGTENNPEIEQLISPAAAQQLRQRARSDASQRGQPGNVQSSSPLATEFRPYEDYSGLTTGDLTAPQHGYYESDSQATYSPDMLQYRTQHPESTSALSRMSGIAENAPMSVQVMPYHTPPFAPNPSALPIIESTTITTTRRPLSAPYPLDQETLPAPSSGPSSNHPSPPLPQSRTSPPYTAIYPSAYAPPPSMIPAGYSSQPMSRDNSHQSAHSMAATEPLSHNPNPGFSPRLAATTNIHPATEPIRTLPVFAPPHQQQLPYPFPLPREGRSLHRPNPEYSDPTTLSSSLPTHQRATSNSNSAPLSRSSSLSPGPGIQLANGQFVGFDSHPQRQHSPQQTFSIQDDDDDAAEKNDNASPTTPSSYPPAATAVAGAGGGRADAVRSPRAYFARGGEAEDDAGIGA